MVERRAEIKRRSYRIQRAIIDHLGGKPDRQFRAFKETMREIETTGDSLEFGSLFATLDHLATGSLKKMTSSHREEMREVVGELQEQLGWKSGAVPEAYSAWKEAEDKRELKSDDLYGI